MKNIYNKSILCNESIDYDEPKCDYNEAISYADANHSFDEFDSFSKAYYNIKVKPNSNAETQNPNYNSSNIMIDNCNYNNCESKSNSMDCCSKNNPYYYKLVLYEVGKSDISVVVGKSPEFTISPEHCEFKIDPSISEFKGVILWGKVKDNCDNVVPNAIVTLLKIKSICGALQYCRVSSTLTDCLGYYQFLIPTGEYTDDYKISLSKPID